MFSHSTGNSLYSAHYPWPVLSYQSYHPLPIRLPRHYQLYPISPVQLPYSSFTTYSGDLRTSRTWSNFHSGRNNFHSYPEPKYGESDTSDTILRPSVIKYEILCYLVTCLCWAHKEIVLVSSPSIPHVMSPLAKIVHFQHLLLGTKKYHQQWHCDLKSQFRKRKVNTTPHMRWTKWQH